jgi:hypothetical protein
MSKRDKLNKWKILVMSLFILRVWWSKLGTVRFEYWSWLLKSWAWKKKTCKSWSREDKEEEGKRLQKLEAPLFLKDPAEWLTMPGLFSAHHEFVLRPWATTPIIPPLGEFSLPIGPTLQLHKSLRLVSSFHWFSHAVFSSLHMNTTCTCPPCQVF